MSLVTKFQWLPNTTAVDGSLLTAAQLAALTYTIIVDTVSPPGPSAVSYSVPPGKVTSVPLGSSTGLQVNFADLTPPFVPVEGTTYFAEITETDSAGTSSPSSIVSFTNVAVPGAPLDFGVA
ncbi:MAG: hypothetical protein ABSD12_27320 [Paraburkholderia sp.]